MAKRVTRGFQNDAKKEDRSRGTIFKKRWFLLISYLPKQRLRNPLKALPWRNVSVCRVSALISSDNPVPGWAEDGIPHPADQHNRRCRCKPAGIQWWKHRKCENRKRPTTKTDLPTVFIKYYPSYWKASDGCVQKGFSLNLLDNCQKPFQKHEKKWYNQQRA